MAPITARVTSQNLGSDEFAGRSLGYVWDPIGLSYVVAQQAGSSGGGGAVTVADGADVAQGATTDVEAAGNGSVIALLKRLRTLIGSVDTKTPALGQALAASSVPIVLTAIQQAALTPPAAITGFALEAGHLAAIDTHLDVALSTRLKPADTLAAVTNLAQLAGTAPVMKAASTAAVAADAALVVALSPATGLPELRASTTVNSSTAAVNTALTATLNAAGAGLFHYITSIVVEKLYSVVGVAAGAGNIVTSTNLGGLAFTTEQLASAAGSVARVVDYRPTTPLKSAVVNTNTTIVCPQQLQTIWRITVTYFIAP